LHTRLHLGAGSAAAIAVTFRPLLGVRLLVIMAAWAAVTAPAAVLAVQDAAARIAAVRFEGVEPSRQTYVEGIVRLKAGDAYDPAQADEAVSRLLRTGRFWSASVSSEDSPEGVVLTFVVRERPVISEIRFEGNTNMGQGRLAPLVPAKVGDLLDRFAVSEGAEAIAAKYRSSGYGDVKVSFDEELLEREGVLVYRVEEGARRRIREILFEGSTAFPDDELVKKIDSRTAWWFLRTGEYDKDRVESDVAAVQRFLRDEGFLDAKVSHRVDLNEDGDIALVFEITEGTRYVIEAIELIGRTVFSEAELRDLTTLREGMFIRRVDLDTDARAIQTQYGEFGYIYATIRPDWVFSAEPGLVRVTHTIVEGDQFRVGKVVVRGNARTKDKVVRRALDMYPPDDLWNVTAARNAERNLRESQIFDEVRVFPVGDGPDVRDVIMDVREADKTGDFVFGFGITSNNGLVGKFSLELRNFDLFDRPRTWSDLARLRSFFGGGQRLNLDLEPGGELNRYRIDFTEPYFLDRPLSLTTSLYLFDRLRDGYEEGRIGTTVSLGKRFDRGVLHGWTGELSARLEGVDIEPDSEFGTSVFLAPDIRRDQGNSVLTSLRAAVVRDRTDNRFIPSTGDRLRLSYEQVGALGGDYVFGRASSAYTWYTTLGTDQLNRKSVLSLHGEAGAIVGNAPIFERYYAGGVGSIRGFAYRQASPRDGLEDNVIGGDILLVGSAEYTYPLVGEWLRGLVFLDTAWLEGFRASVGTGVRMTVEFLGPVPLELHFSAPLATEDGDEEEYFSFVIGGALSR
jgi:outer membrane protein assembly complex protein YaeT